MDRYTPNNYFASPIEAARWRSRLDAGRYGKFYMVYIPMPNYAQKLSRSFSRHNIEQSVSYGFTETNPMMAESCAGILIYKDAEHLELLSYPEDAKDNEAGSCGWLFGTLITPTDYSVSCTWWGRIVVEQLALKGFNDHYRN